MNSLALGADRGGYVDVPAVIFEAFICGLFGVCDVACAGIAGLDADRLAFVADIIEREFESYHISSCVCSLSANSGSGLLVAVLIVSGVGAYGYLS